MEEEPQGARDNQQEGAEEEVSHLSIASVKARSFSRNLVCMSLRGRLMNASLHHHRRRLMMQSWGPSPNKEPPPWEPSPLQQLEAKAPPAPVAVRDNHARHLPREAAASNVLLRRRDRRRRLPCLRRCRRAFLARRHPAQPWPQSRLRLLPALVTRRRARAAAKLQEECPHRLPNLPRVSQHSTLTPKSLEEKTRRPHRSPPHRKAAAAVLQRQASPRPPPSPRLPKR